METEIAREAELFGRFARRIWLYGQRHLRDAAGADDLVQHVLFVVLQMVREGKVREPEKLPSVVLGTCRMVVRDLRRGEARRKRLLEQFGPTVEAMQDAEPPLDVERLRGCMERLDDRERTIVVDTFYADRSAEEIASSLGMTAGNVRVVRHRAVARLRQCIGLGGEEGTS
jgi:RNA polymerase sigma-70 factor (ECF subfamily)